jgi:hypothetical protein
MEMPNNSFFDDCKEAKHYQKGHRPVERRDYEWILFGKTIAKSEPSSNQQEFGAHKRLDQSEQPGRETDPLSVQDGRLESSQGAEANKKISRENRVLSQFSLESYL